MNARVISSWLVALFFMVIVCLCIRNNPVSDDSEIIDVLIDAGFEFSVNPLDTELLSHRKIVITTDINAISAQRTIKSLLLLDSIDGVLPIDLYIRTEGGWVSDTFAIIDVMKSLSAPVNTYAIGGTHSSGAMILAAGTGERLAYPHSSIMFHAGLYEEGDHGEALIDNDRLTKFWKETSRIPEEWLSATEDDTYFLTPEKAQEYGLIDKIVPEVSRAITSDGAN